MLEQSAVAKPKELPQQLAWVSYPVVVYPSIPDDRRMAKPSPTYAGSPALMAIGKAIRKARLEQGMSQEVLAHDAGLDRSYVGGIERGAHNPTIMKFLRIADQLGIKASELMRRSGL